MAVTTPAVPATTVLQPNQTGQWVDAAVTGGTITGIFSYPAISPVITTPAVPASTVNATNTNPFPVVVNVTGGTVTAITVNGVATGLTTGKVIVPAGGTINTTNTGAPAWTWTPAVAGFAGTAIPSPSSVPVMPGGSVELDYSVAPTWAWTDPLDVGYSPGYSQENQVLVSEVSQLPWPAHAEGGEAGLGVAIDN